MNPVFKESCFTKLASYNTQLGGKTVQIIEDEPLTDDALAYFRILLDANTKLSSYAITTIADLIPRLEDANRDAMNVIHTATNYDRVQGGHVDYTGDRSVPESSAIKYLTAEEKITKRYNAAILPAVKIHKALLKASVTLTEEDGFRTMLRMSISSSMPLSYAFDKTRGVTGYQYTESKHAWDVLKRDLLNVGGYITFPKFDSREIAVLHDMKVRAIDRRSQQFWAESKGFGTSELENMTNYQKYAVVQPQIHGWNHYKFLRMANAYEDPIAVLCVAYDEMTPEAREEATRAKENLKDQMEFEEIVARCQAQWRAKKAARAAAK